MRTFLQMANIQTLALPDKFTRDDTRYPDELPRYFIEEFSRRGDVVVDPFGGFGTTMRVAEDMGRVGYAVEYDPERANYIRTVVTHPERVFNGDSRDFAAVPVPDGIALTLTSPPYMGRTHIENPFTAYTTTGGGYGAYLNDIGAIYAQIKLKTKRGGYAVVEVSNLKHEDGSITTLAWDIGKVLSDIWEFLGEVVIGWQPTYGYGYDHSYALVFRND